MSAPQNARYCNMCNDYRPVSCFASIPGEGDTKAHPKRKENVCNLHDIEEETTRFCKTCDAFSPVSNFPPGKRVYLCRKHRYMRSQQKSQMKLRNKPGQRQKTRLWHQCFVDRIKFKQPSIKIKTHEIQALVLKVDPESIGGYLVVPKDPLLPVTPENIQVVTEKNRKILMKFITKGDYDAYTAMLRQIVLT
jgi:hypothetical protein